MQTFFCCVVLIFCTLVTDCVSETAYAPVVEGWLQPDAQTGSYIAKQGDTLYSIAWTFGLDYRALAKINDLAPPYDVHPGQHLRMTIKPESNDEQPIPRLAQQQPKRSNTSASVTHMNNMATHPNAKTDSNHTNTKAHPALSSAKSKIPKANVSARPNSWLLNRPVKHWHWPTHGKVIQRFSQKLGGNKGIDIAGQYGAPVRTAAPGVVVYSGDGVRGYGNLIIIKHNQHFLSAYAYNRRLLAKLGAHVHGGQKIAEVGRNDERKNILHFEVRRNGKPVDPLKYLR